MRVWWGNRMGVRRWSGKVRQLQSRWRKWEQVCRWVGQSGDGERRGSVRTPGGWMENGIKERPQGKKETNNICLKHFVHINVCKMWYLVLRGRHNVATHPCWRYKVCVYCSSLKPLLMFLLEHAHSDRLYVLVISNSCTLFAEFWFTFLFSWQILLNAGLFPYMMLVWIIACWKIRINI